ncbi:MAG TPA: hypothetical protein ENK31_02245 [Nannocystis exedens]|nr:hypothetical protein [Nannocystis exedens]
MQQSSYVLLPLLALGLNASGCGDEFPPGSCEASVAPTCEIQEAECVEQYSDHVACIRGVEAETPMLTVLSEAEMAMRFESEPSVIDPCLRLAQLEAFAEPPESDDPPAVSAYYDFDDKTVFVVPPGDSRSLLRIVAMAQLDAERDLLGEISSAGTFDGKLARRSRLFGEARFFGDAAWWKIEPIATDDLRNFVDNNIYYEDELAKVLQVVRVPDLGLDVLIAVFDFYGAQYVRDRWLADDLVSATGDLRSSEIIGGQAQAETGGQWTEPSAEGYTVQWADSMGAFLAHVHFTRTNPPEPEEPEESIATDRERLSTLVNLFAGDRMTCLYNSEQESAALVWEIMLDDPSALPYTLAPGIFGAKQVVLGDRIVIAAAEDSTVVDALLAEF